MTTEKAYRELEPGEIVQAGDECEVLIDSANGRHEWVPVASTGWEIPDRPGRARYRRPITTEQPRNAKQTAILDHLDAVRAAILSLPADMYVGWHGDRMSVYLDRDDFVAKFSGRRVTFDSADGMLSIVDGGVKWCSLGKEQKPATEEITL